MRTQVADSMRWFTVLALLSIPAMAQGPVEEAKPAPDLRISRSAICLQVENREPVDIDTRFRQDVDRLFAYTKVEGITNPTQITHVWYHGDREMARVKLDVRNTGWRTWSSKRILPSWTGTWKVAVLDEGGTPLKTLEFTIGEPATVEGQETQE